MTTKQTSIFNDWWVVYRPRDSREPNRNWEAMALFPLKKMGVEWKNSLPHRNNDIVRELKDNI